MRVKVVTGFVPLDNPRAVKEYERLGRQLFTIRHPIRFFNERIGDCWLWEHIRRNSLTPTHSIYDNPRKNTMAYHCVQHQKTEWLLRTAMDDTKADVFVWIDYGIFHVPGITEQVILNYLERVDDRGISVPGCWSRGPVYDQSPSWRFCGGLVAVPRGSLMDFDQAVKKEAKRHIAETNNVSWEVNTWSRMEERGFPFHWYSADHNQTMFTGYK